MISYARALFLAIISFVLYCASNLDIYFMFTQNIKNPIVQKIYRNRVSVTNKGALFVLSDWEFLKNNVFLSIYLLGKHNINERHDSVIQNSLLISDSQWK